MRAGTLRHRVALYRPPLDQERNVYGEPTSEPVEIRSSAVDGKWWADITPVGGGEVESGGQVRATVSHQIRMRWVATLNPSPGWEAVYNARTFRFTSVVTVDERFKEVLISATEMVGQFPSV